MREESIAGKMYHETVVPVDRLGASAVKGRHGIQQLFGICFRCRRRKADDAGGQHGYWATLDQRVTARRCGWRFDRSSRVSVFVFSLRHRSDEAIAAPRNGSDAASAASTAVEDAAERQDPD